MASVPAGPVLGAAYGELEQLLPSATTEGAALYAVWGPRRRDDESPRADALRRAGVHWNWAAVGIRDCSFWDIHVGILSPGGLARESSGGLIVGLHWSFDWDGRVRPWAESVVPGGVERYSSTIQEHQLCDDSNGVPAVHDPQGAARLAIRIATRALGALTAQEAPNRPLTTS